MSQPSWPPRGSVPWDATLKAYIDAGDENAVGVSGPELIRSVVQLTDGVIPERPDATIVFWYCWDNPVESMDQYDTVILIPAPGV